MSLQHILCIDDEEDILMVAKLALETIGQYQVVVFGDGQTGLAEARKAPPDVILVDVMMPQMDGPAVLAEAKNDPVLARIPVIFMTAKVQPSEVSHYLALGASGVIPKPFDAVTLSREVETLWKAFHDRNRS